MRLRLVKFFQKKHYSYYANIIESIMSQNFHFKQINALLNLPFGTLQEYLDLISLIHFSRLNELDNLRFYLYFTKFEKDLKQNLLKQLLYPFFLFILSFFLTIYFNTYFAPTIFSMLEDFKVSKVSLNIIFLISYLLKYLWYALFLLMIVVLIFLMSKDLRYVFYIRFHKIPLFSLIRNILTLRFVYVYHFFLSKGVNTQGFLKEISEVSGLKDVKWLSYHIAEKMSSGIELLKAFDTTYFNEFLIVYLQKGFYNQNLIFSLEEYLEILEIIVKNQFKKFIIIFKIFVYSYIVMFIVIYYIFLFQPLTILEGLV